jgi:hypothetical protein
LLARDLRLGARSNETQQQEHAHRATGDRPFRRTPAPAL